MEIYLNELLYELSFALDCVERDLLGAATNHSKRVAACCLSMAEALGMDEAARADLACCAVLHDNALTEYILSERAQGGSIGEKGRVNLKSHCALGEKNIQGFPFAGRVDGVILHHHENADGSGCFGVPAGQTPLGAQLIRVADNVDVLYNLSITADDKRGRVREHVERCAGSLYTPRAAGAFLEFLDSFPLSRLADGEITGVLHSLTPPGRVRCTSEHLLSIASVFAKIIDYKSPFTRRHSSGIAEKAGILAAHYGYAEEDRVKLILAAALHDVGKLAVDTQILEKPGALTPEEYRAVQQHVTYTFVMLSGVTGFEDINRWASSHHEKLDGSGYPFGKGAAELDFNSRMLACIDIYQALSEDRPYRKGMSHRETMEIVSHMAEQGLLDDRIVRDMGAVFGSAPIPA